MATVAVVRPRMVQRVCLLESLCVSMYFCIKVSATRRACPTGGARGALQQPWIQRKNEGGVWTKRIGLSLSAAKAATPHLQ